MEIEKLITEATKGNKAALENIVTSIQDNIYNLALRMLVNPDDAMDATQKILIKVITNLSSFRFESQFNTWVYRIATNHLINEKKIREKDLGLTFDIYQQDLESDLQEPSQQKNDPQYEVLLNELRISCTMAMLLCLNPPHRMAYILGDIFELNHGEASLILSISKESFRKRLSRARADIVEFTSKSCGLISDSAKCTCEKKLNGAIKRQRINPEHIFFAGEEYSYSNIKQSLSETQHALKTLALQNAVSFYKCPTILSDVIKSLVNEAINTNRTLNH